jgi:hypothetical protein
LAVLQPAARNLPHPNQQRHSPSSPGAQAIVWNCVFPAASGAATVDIRIDVNKTGASPSPQVVVGFIRVKAKQPE